MSMDFTIPMRRYLIVALRLVILAVASCGLLAQAAPAHAQTEADPGSDFYGINFVSPFDPWLRIARDSGARYVRWQFNWRDHETSPGVWDWTKSDGAIRAWNEAGFKVHAILHNPPPFALANPGGLVPTNLDAPYYNPMPSFSRYCYTFAQRYQGQIASYEVWNEPDLTQYWEGTPAQYYTLLKGCYVGIKAADPAATVVMAGMAYTSNRQFFREVVRLAASDPDAPYHNNYFDAAAIHPYGDPEQVYTVAVDTRNLLTHYNMGGKPIWITETNVALRGVNGVPDIPHWGLASEEEAGWYVLQAASNAYAAGASELMFFRLNDADMTEVWGLVRNDGSPRPAYQALQLATTILRDITEASREVSNGVVITTLRRADSARIITLYSKSGQSATVSVKAESSAAVLINSAGGYSTIEPDAQGQYTITLPPAHDRDFNRPGAYSVGGPVMIILEVDRTPPVTRVEIVPLPFDKTHVMVRWHGSDGQFGTGVAAYDVEVSVDGGPWQPWQTATTETQAIYDISAGGSFAFRARAVDRVGNQGEFGEPAQTNLRLVGTLVVHIVDLRGQDVPSARIELADGSLYDTDAAGRARIELPPGTIQIVQVDGAGQGQLKPPPVEIALDTEMTVTWMLLPTLNLIGDGGFEHGLGYWVGSSPVDVQRLESDDTQHGAVLHLSGQRRPWGPPAATIHLDVPPEMTAGVLSFTYRLLEDGQTLRVRVVTGEEQRTLWQTNAPGTDFTRVWIDMSTYVGQSISLFFELWGPKGSPASAAEIDDLILGNVPVLP